MPPKASNDSMDLDSNIQTNELQGWHVSLKSNHPNEEAAMFATINKEV